MTCASSDLIGLVAQAQAKAAALTVERAGLLAQIEAANREIIWLRGIVAYARNPLPVERPARITCRPPPHMINCLSCGLTDSRHVEGCTRPACPMQEGLAR
ncbi:MAG: hypothetical protein ACRC56_11990 [Bosea sp. (in: a-proteobacteria)]